MGNNISYGKKVCYNISMIDLTENRKIKIFKTEITKTIINQHRIILKNYVIVKNLIV